MTDAASTRWPLAWPPPAAEGGDTLARLQDAYLGLMEACLTGALVRDAASAPFGRRAYDAHLREYGLDWPATALTMIGRKRLANLRALTMAVIADGVPGDLMETGVWRGGACIMMRAVLRAFGIGDRRVWVADSFVGLPTPDAQCYPADAESNFHTYDELAIPLDQVRDNFRRFGLLDAQVEFLPGWFKDTLPHAPIERLALLRLDGDMYESTMDALSHLFPRLSDQGYLIVDDYHAVPACKSAVDDYFAANGFAPQWNEIDGVGVYWKKSLHAQQDAAITSPRMPPLAAQTQKAELSLALADLMENLVMVFDSVLAARDVDAQALTAELAERGAALDASRRALIEQEQATAGLASALAERAGERDALAGELARLHASASWRITGPLRTLRALMRQLLVRRGGGRKSR